VVSKENLGHSGNCQLYFMSRLFFLFGSNILKLRAEYNYCLAHSILKIGGRESQNLIERNNRLNSSKLVSMLVRFLEQNGGTLSKRARLKEFPELKDDEVGKIESAFHDFFEI